MKKFVCNVCGYVYEGDAAPEKCPQCNAPASKFTEQAGDKTWAAEHVVGVAQGSSEDIMEDLHTVKVILKSVFTGKRLLMKRQNMLQNSLNYWVKLLLTAPKRTWKCV